VMHIAVRPWPWILVALASLIIYPDLASIQEAFPNVTADKLGHDLAYPAMLTMLPSGLLGLVLASLGAAYMSTLSTHLNWGSSYVVNDFYKQKINPAASEKELVRVGRVSTLLLMVFSAFIALNMQNAKELFDLILMFGAGTGLIFILRWFWWRINAWSEISAMFASGIISLLIKKTSLGPLLFGTAEAAGVFPTWAELPVAVLITSLIWIAVTFLTPPEKEAVLQKFNNKIQAGGPGWKKFQSNEEQTTAWVVPRGLLAVLLGSVFVYSTLFAVGNWLYGEVFWAILLLLTALVSGFLLKLQWGKLKEVF